jgi:hypothetical protein
VRADFVAGNCGSIPRSGEFTQASENSPCIPTVAQAALLAEVPQTVARIVGLSIGFTDANAIRSRCANLLSAERAASVEAGPFSHLEESKCGPCGPRRRILISTIRSALMR